MLTVINASVAVDTFFVMSGALVTYNFYKMLDSQTEKISIPLFYLHRYLRLTPMYAIVVGIRATLVPYFGNGPFWAIMTSLSNNCEHNWWTNLLYVNNFVNTSSPCLGHTFYLANDMQFYIMSPLIIYPMWRWEMLGLVLLVVYTMISCASPALLIHYLDTTPTTIYTRAYETWYREIYNRPYARMQTFLVGIWLGWMIYKTRGKRVKLSIFVVILFWLLSTIVCLAVIYSIQDWFDPSYEIPKISGLTYAALSRFGWGLSVSWIIFACIKGYGGMVNSILSWSLFRPLSRLCYSVYLVSLPLQMIFHIRFTLPIKFDLYTILNFFFAHMVISFLVGFIFTVLFESPFIILQKLIFKGKTGSSKSKFPGNSMKKSNASDYRNPHNILDENDKVGAISSTYTMQKYITVIRI